MNNATDSSAFPLRTYIDFHRFPVSHRASQWLQPRRKAGHERLLSAREAVTVTFRIWILYVEGYGGTGWVDPNPPAVPNPAITSAVIATRTAPCRAVDCALYSLSR